MKGLLITSLTVMLALIVFAAMGCQQDERQPGTPEDGDTNGAETTPPADAQVNQRVTEQAYDSIEDNMTMQQVAEILGPPTTAQPPMPEGGDPNFTGQATWVGAAQTVRISFENGRVTEKDMEDNN